MKKFVVPDGWIDDEDPKYVEKQKARQASLKIEQDLEAAKEKSAADKAKADAKATAEADKAKESAAKEAAAKATKAPTTAKTADAKG